MKFLGNQYFMPMGDPSAARVFNGSTVALAGVAQSFEYCSSLLMTGRTHVSRATCTNCEELVVMYYSIAICCVLGVNPFL